MDSDVVFNCGSESVINHNLFELRFFICLCRFGEKINNCRSVKRVRRSVKRVGRNFLYSVWILRTIFEKFRIHWGYYVQFFGEFRILAVECVQYGVQVEFRREYVRIICDHVSTEREAAGDGDGKSKNR